MSETISRTARNVLRKLGPGERITEPFRLIKCSQSNPKPLILTAAAAMLYGVCQEGLEETVLAERLDAQMKELVMECYNRLKKGISVTKAME